MRCQPRSSAVKSGVNVGQEGRGPVLACLARGFPAHHRHSPPGRAGTPCSLQEWFEIGARLCPQGRAGTCPGTSWDPHRARAVAASPPRRRRAWLPATGLLPAGPARGGPRPLVRRPAPAVSREILDLGGSFAGKSGVTVGHHAVPGGCWAGTLPWCWPLPWGGGAVCPRECFGGLLCSWGSKGRSKRCWGCTARHDARHPAPTLGTPLRHQAIGHGTPGRRAV